MRVLLYAIAFIFSLFASAHTAFAQGCAPAGEMFKTLKEKYQEEPIAIGSAGRNFIVILASPSGSFTILSIVGGNRACPILAGQDFSLNNDKKKEETF